VNDSAAFRRFGRVFDQVADQYDAARRGYPEALIDRAAARGGLRTGSQVVEVGCGTGKLTAALVARGFRVRAVDPGANMIEVARRRLGRGEAQARFDVGVFEDAELPEATFNGLFSATAFHWPDPRVSWRKAASVLKPAGLLALLSHAGLHDEQSAALDLQFREILARHAPEVAASLGRSRDLEALLAGAEARLENASEVWDWVMGGQHGLAVPEAAELFRDVEVDVETSSVAETADQGLAFLRTTSLYFRIDPDRRAAFEEEYRGIVARAGGRARFTLATVLMTARRAERLRR
jgi:ubiquinone/menaquinone biosynthesis C-methylase UbiE